MNDTNKDTDKATTHGLADTSSEGTTTDATLVTAEAASSAVAEPVTVADTSVTSATDEKSASNEKSDAPTVTSASADTDTTDVSPVNTTPAPTSSASVAAKHRTVLMQYGIAGVIILMMGLGLLYIMESQGRVNTAVFATVERLIKGEPAAVIVNGEKVPLATYEKSVAQLSNMAAEQGMNPTDPSLVTEIRDQAIELLINTEVLRQAAVAAGVTVTDEEVETRFTDIVAQLGSEDALAARLGEMGSTLDTLRTDIRGEILIQSYLDQAIDTSDVVISDEEAKAQYDQLVEFYSTQSPDGTAPVDIPPFDEAKADIIESMVAEQEQIRIGEHIDALRTAATIETLI